MTRINVVPVEELNRLHLVAEYRELPRMYKFAKDHFLKYGKPFNVPNAYILGKGHMMFFVNKLGYIHKRHKLLIEEMKIRGYEPKFNATLDKSVIDLPSNFWGSYNPTAHAMTINRARISDRLRSMKSA